MAPVVTAWSVSKIASPTRWRESDRGALPKDLRGLDPISPEERAERKAAGTDFTF